MPMVLVHARAGGGVIVDVPFLCLLHVASTQIFLSLGCDHCYRPYTYCSCF